MSIEDHIADHIQDDMLSEDGGDECPICWSSNLYLDGDVVCCADCGWEDEGWEDEG
jgi:hypothetical protein